jgi:hypothetical protein
LIIDWECCGYTKNNAPLDARETLENYKTKDRIMEENKRYNRT